MVGVGGHCPDPWMPHVLHRDTFVRNRVVVRRCNSDNLILFKIGELIAKGNYNLLIIGTGDGNLGVDIARFVDQASEGKIDMVTIGFPGTMSGQLRAGRNMISRDFLIGSDMLVPFNAPRIISNPATKQPTKGLLWRFLGGLRRVYFG